MALSSVGLPNQEILASLDIAEVEHRKDGQVQRPNSKIGQSIFAVSSLPSLFGEKVVIRVLSSVVHPEFGVDSAFQIGNFQH